jgi:hypothetical protein
MKNLTRTVLFLVLFWFLVLAQSKIVYVAEVSRHGARTPGKIFNFTENEEDNFKLSKQLTAMGMRQHHLIGHEIRNRYIEKEQVINSTYHYKEIGFYSTDTDRTLDSSESQITGIFPLEICQQKLNDFQKKNAVPPLVVDNVEKIQKELGDFALPECFNVLPYYSQSNPDDYLIHFEKSDCPRYQQLAKELKNSTEFEEMNAPYLRYLIPRFHELTNSTEALTWEDVKNMCSYLSIADFHNVKLKFNYTQQDLDECSGIDTNKYYFISWGKR